MKSFVLIANESGTDDSVITHLRDISSITNVYGTFGSYDLLTKLESSNEQLMQNDILNGITKINNIKATLTLLVDGPGILKTTTLGYDGKGQHPIKSIEELNKKYWILICLTHML